MAKRHIGNIGSLRGSSQNEELWTLRDGTIWHVRSQAIGSCTIADQLVPTETPNLYKHHPRGHWMRLDTFYRIVIEELLNQVETLESERNAEPERNALINAHVHPALATALNAAMK